MTYKELVPQKIKPEHCSKHDKCLAWTCPRCASYFSHNEVICELKPLLKYVEGLEVEVKRENLDLTAAYMAGFERGKDSVHLNAEKGERCPDCFGTGKLDNGDGFTAVCNICHGTGKPSAMGEDDIHELKKIIILWGMNNRIGISDGEISSLTHAIAEKRR